MLDRWEQLFLTISSGPSSQQLQGRESKSAGPALTQHLCSWENEGISTPRKILVFDLGNMNILGQTVTHAHGDENVSSVEILICKLEILCDDKLGILNFFMVVKIY